MEGEELDERTGSEGEGAHHAHSEDEPRLEDGPGGEIPPLHGPPEEVGTRSRSKRVDKGEDPPSEESELASVGDPPLDGLVGEMLRELRQGGPTQEAILEAQRGMQGRQEEQMVKFQREMVRQQQEFQQQLWEHFQRLSKSGDGSEPVQFSLGPVRR